jgi:hypothetical protein
LRAGGVVLSEAVERASELVVTGREAVEPLDRAAEALRRGGRVAGVQLLRADGRQRRGFLRLLRQRSETIRLRRLSARARLVARGGQRLREDDVWRGQVGPQLDSAFERRRRVLEIAECLEDRADRQVRVGVRRVRGGGVGERLHGAIEIAEMPVDDAKGVVDLGPGLNRERRVQLVERGLEPVGVVLDEREVVARERVPPIERKRVVEALDRAVDFDVGLRQAEREPGLGVFR